MRRTFLGWMTAAVLTATVVAGCGGGGGDASSFQYDPPPAGPTPPPQQTVRFNIPSHGAGDQAVMVFTPVSGDEWDLANNFVQVNGVNARQENPQAPEAAGTYTDRCGTTRSLILFDEKVGVAKARARAESLKQRAVQPRWDGLPKGTTGQLIRPLVGDPAAQITVTKMLADAQTVHCNVLAETSGGVPVITEADALRLAQIFDAANPYDPQTPGIIGIYDRITGLCGTEWRTNPVGGRDGDLRVNLVMCSNATMGTGLLGVVQFEDSFPQSIAPSSNEGEYLYLNYQFLGVPGGTDLQNYSLYGTLAHEFLHIVQMNTKVGRDGTFPNFDPDTPDVNTSAYSLWERRTMAEGFSETAATLCGFGVHKALDATPTGGAEIFSYDAINLFMGGSSVFIPGAFGPTQLGSNFWTPFLDYAGTDPYGIGHLFGLHIVNRYGAAKWGELTSSRHIGLLNLNTTLGAAPEDIFHGFNIALSASSLAGVPAQYDLPKIALGGLNQYRNFQSAAAPIPHVLNGPGFAASGGPTMAFGENYQPWSTVLFRFLGGTGAPLNIEVTLPLKAKASLIRESPVGTWSGIQ